MIWPIIQVFIFSLLKQFQSHEVLVAYNCGSHTNITTKYVKYTSDQMYQGLTSRMALKSSLPSTIVDEQDKKLLISQRVTDFDAFSYYFKISSRDHYLLVFKFVEVVNKQKGQRIFNIKIGDQIVHKIDIIQQVGYGNILHKWISFDLKEDIIYLNKTYPALNAYIYTKRLLKVTFEKVIGMPKIDAVILIKGDDAEKFLNDYISYEQTKNIIVREYVSEKYHILPQRKYKKLINRLDFIQEDTNIIILLIKKYFWKVIVSICGVGFLIFHQDIYKKVGEFHQQKIKGGKININGSKTQDNSHVNESNKQKKNKND